ncbi:MAG: metallophosphoesterase [Candidatus Gastranaerophilaceae bacterium]
MKIIRFILLISIVILAFYSFYIEPNKITITEYFVEDKALSGIKVVFAGDFHVKPHQKKRLKEIIDLINRQNPDIVLSTSDFPSGHVKFLTMPIEDIAKEFKNLTADFYTSLGNHDQYFGADYVKKQLEDNNVNVLYNSNKKIKIKGKDIYIAGIQYKPKDKTVIEDTLKNTKSPIIMLTHSPDEITKMPDNINLILAGHTHGGQIVLPIIGPLFTASKYHKKYAYGFINDNGKKLITNRGIGLSILPFRFNCPPEIVVINFIYR